ncbi:MAG: hypothetical protein LKF88_02330 [Microbacteriaceae bacterium]|nr:hypothetical protein [Microbacteriaceae bacterium]MCI1206681.1 hypothetical protein [Microbacteriaceae bacterium]
MSPHPETQKPGGDDPDGGAAALRASRGRHHRRVRLPGGGVPVPTETPPEESAQAWGDRPDDEDAWLRDQVPPHWQNP